MIVKDVSQGTEVWHAWRAEGLTATCCSVIMGLHPDVTPWQLWAEKCGFRILDDLSKNPYVIRGQLREPKARIAAEKYLKEHEGLNEILLPLCGESEENRIIRASMDGVTSANRPVELKCLSESNVEDVKTNREESKAYKLYWPQVQHQLKVLDADYGWLGVYWENEVTRESGIEMFKIYRDDQFLAEYMIKSQEFWELIVERKEPKKDLQRDFFVPSKLQASAWMHHAGNYAQLDDAIKELEEKAAKLKESRDKHLEPLVGMMEDEGYFKADFGGVQITRFNQVGRTDWKKMVEENLPNFESLVVHYTGGESLRRRVTSKCEMTPKQIVMPEITNLAETSKADTIESFF